MGSRGPQRLTALGIPPRRSTPRSDAPKPGVFRGPRYTDRDEYPPPVYEAGFCFKDFAMAAASCFPAPSLLIVYDKNREMQKDRKREVTSLKFAV